MENGQGNRDLRAECQLSYLCIIKLLADRTQIGKNVLQIMG